MLSMEGRAAFITGAARGQGRSHAVHLAKLGADIIAVDICAPVESVEYAMATPADLRETVRLVEQTGRRVVSAVADVRDLDALRAAVDRGVNEFGRLDVVVANAGVLPPFREKPSLSASLRDTLDINLIGVQHTIDAAVDHMIAAGNGGAIVLISSVAGLRALRVGEGYTESKHALVGLMKGAAIRLAPYAIRVNTIHPTTVRTPMVLNEWSYKLFRPDLEEPTLAQCLAGMASINLLPVPYVEPEDISRAVEFLVSDTGRYITGAAIPVDAGASLK